MPNRDAIKRALKNQHISFLDSKADRLEWLWEQYPERGMFLMGDYAIQRLTEEAWECFIHGHFMAVVIVSMSAAEQALRHQLNIMDDDFRGQRMTLSTICQTAKSEGLLSKSTYEKVDSVREIRNSYVHHRDPQDDESFSERMMDPVTHPYIVSEDDAREGIQAMFCVLQEVTENYGNSV